jgi:hypothetical protein
MDKKIIIYLGIFLMIAILIFAGRKLMPQAKCEGENGKDVVINMRILHNQWKWDPDEIVVDCQYNVTLNII